MKKYNLIFVALFLYVWNVSAQMDFEVIKINNKSLAEKRKTAIITLARYGDDQMEIVSGESNKKKGELAETNDLFEIGSVTKMFTAVSILQLIEKGKLSFSTPVSTFYSDDMDKLANFEENNYWKEITIEMLLNHTSGMIDYLNVYGNDKKAMRKLAKKNKVYSFQEIINLAINHGDMNFKPGNQFKYCNTGYVILGDIISKVSGTDWRNYIQTNIFAVVGMDHSFFGSLSTDSLENLKMNGYFKGKPSFMPASLAGAAGEIVSSIEDLERFILSWGRGDLYQKKETLELQKTKGFKVMYPEKTNKIQYGYGIMNIDGYYGHGGQTFGFQSFVGYNPIKGNLYVIGANDAVKMPVMSVFLMFAQISLN